jgi:ABC-type multidrug transport system ATPase subunit
MIPISINSISKSYGKLKALNNISLDVEQGELFGLIGPDGAGKTTIIRLITSLLLPDEGNISVFGMDSVKDFRKIRNIVGYMPGRFSLYADLTVQENLEFFAGVFGTTIQENYALIKDIYIHLEPYKNRLAGKLSGGMKQKLALSCALIHRPKLLLLDEPTTGVDAVSRREFWDMLRRLKNEGIAILVSTSYMDEASMCEKVALMQYGKVLGVDTPFGLIDKYPNRLYSLRSDNIYDLLMLLRSQSFTKSAYLFGQDIHLTIESDSITQDELIETSANLGVQLTDIKEIKATVEDSFMWLMDTKESTTHIQQ